MRRIISDAAATAKNSDWLFRAKYLSVRDWLTSPVMGFLMESPSKLLFAVASPYRNAVRGFKLSTLYSTNFVGSIATISLSGI
jgi:hypothetical protein